VAARPDPTQRFRLDERTVIVTGASSGLGYRFARVVAAAGATVVVGARRRAHLEALVDDMRSEGADAVAVKCDVTIDADVDRLIAAGIDATGQVDVLVNAAGVAPAEDEEIESPGLFRRVLEVNAVGLYSCARAAARVMLDRGTGSMSTSLRSAGWLPVTDPTLPPMPPRKGRWSTSRGSSRCGGRLAESASTHLPRDGFHRR
jgi:NAD(P)-dependent dehydrogenase (short-subunit alcohol dehydrogenase family)